MLQPAMEGKPGGKSLQEWVGAKVSDPPPALSDALVDPQMIGIPAIGTEILGGKYRLDRIIGIGGMGVVMAATHKQLGQQVAVKFLSGTMQTPELVDRFVREGQAAVRIKSEHIASVLDVGVLESGTPYLMMEYLSGADLSEYLNEHGAVPFEPAIDFMLQTCDALAVAHASGIVHRDLKPSNLFMTQRSDGSPLIKVLDFGISKVSQIGPDPKMTLTRPGMMLGSPRYMSPEQLRNASSVDHRADIWALGIVLHELVAGTPPYDADTFAALCAMIATDAPPRVRTLKPDVPEALEEIILRCVEKDPAARWQNVAELAMALAPMAPSESRIMAARTAKILGHVATRTPPGAYKSTKVSPISPGASGAPRAGATPPGSPQEATHDPRGNKPSTPKPADRTLPLLAPPSDGRSDAASVASGRPSAETPVKGAPPSTDPRSNPVRSESAPSALAVSNARLATNPPSGAKLAPLALVALLGIAAAGFFFLRESRSRSHPPTSGVATTASPEAASPLPPPATTAATTTKAEQPGAAVTADVVGTPGGELDGGGAKATAAVPTPPAATPVAVPVNPGYRRNGPGPGARPTPAPAVSSALPAAPKPPEPSETDMLNRRR